MFIIIRCWLNIICIYFCITRGEIAGRYRYLGVEYQLTLFLLANTCPNQKRCPRTYIPFGQDSEANYAPIVSPPVAETSTADRRETGCGPGRLSPSRPLGRGSSPWGRARAATWRSWAPGSLWWVGIAGVVWVPPFGHSHWLKCKYMYVTYTSVLHDIVYIHVHVYGTTVYTIIDCHCLHDHRLRVPLMDACAIISFDYAYD